MVAFVGAGIGALVGVALVWFGVGKEALWGGAVVGAILPLVVLGKPGK